MTLSQAILDLIKNNYLGIENPISLEALLKWLHDRRYINITDEKSRRNADRRVRQIISIHQKICNAGEGYYWGRSKGHKEDVEEAIQYIERTYKYPINHKIEEKKKAFRQYYPEPDMCQGDLF